MKVVKKWTPIELILDHILQVPHTFSLLCPQETFLRRSLVPRAGEENSTVDSLFIIGLDFEFSLCLIKVIFIIHLFGQCNQACHNHSNCHCTQYEMQLKNVQNTSIRACSLFLL